MWLSLISQTGKLLDIHARKTGKVIPALLTQNNYTSPPIENIKIYKNNDYF